MAILPYNGVLAISTIKDTLFTGLCAMLCLTLWEIAEAPEAFLSRKRNLARLFGICLTMSLLRHNAVFATLPALLVVILLCRNGAKRLSPPAPSRCSSVWPRRAVCNTRPTPRHFSAPS